MERLPFQYQKRPFWEFLCPICKRERRSFYWPSPRNRHYAGLASLGILLTIVLWQDVGFKGVFLVLPVWAVFELFYRARARQSLICPHCAFDPYLYKYDSKLARKQVAAHFANLKKEREDARLKSPAPSKAPAPTKRPTPPNAPSGP